MLTNLWNWILANPAEAGGLVALLITAAVVLVQTLRAKGSLREALLAAMLRFERDRRKGHIDPVDGPQIMSMVVNWAWATVVPRLPFWLRPMITPERLQTWAQALFDASLDLLDDGLLNGTRPTLEDEQSSERPPSFLARWKAASGDSNHKELPMFPVDLRSAAEKELPTDDPPGAA